jgi:hypothetical protein
MDGCSELEQVPKVIRTYMGKKNVKIKDIIRDHVSKEMKMPPENLELYNRYF